MSVIEPGCYVSHFTGWSGIVTKIHKRSLGCDVAEILVLRGALGTSVARRITTCIETTSLTTCDLVEMTEQEKLWAVPDSEYLITKAE